MRRLPPSFVVLAGLALLGATLQGAAPAFWQASTQADFLKGDGDTVAIDTDGRVTLGPALTALGDPEAAAVWRGLLIDGDLYAGAGSDGKVFKIGRTGAATVFFDADELQVHALAAGPNRSVYVGTSPDGKVYRVEQDGSSRVVLDPEERYVWALASATDGTLYVATGEKAAVYRVSPAGEAKKIYSGAAAHVTALAVSPSGAVVIGTDSPGQVIRLDAAGKPFVLLDSPLREIRALRFEPGGRLFAAGMSGRASIDARPATTATPVGEPAPVSANPVPTVTTEVVITAIGDASSTAAATRSADTKRDLKGAVYSIAPDGLWDTVWESSDDLPYDVAPDGGGLIVVTGNKGKVFRVSLDVPRVTLATRVPAQQVTGLLGSAATGWHLLTANPGKAYRLGSGPAERGTFLSEVYDASGPASWGVLRWTAQVPQGASVSLHTRSGNTARPDDTWSDWSPAATNADGQPIASPKARYLQWKAVLQGSASASPVLTSVIAAYLPRNVRPEVSSVTVHPPGTVFLRPYSSGEFDIAGFDAGTSDGRNLTSVAAAAPQQTQPALGRKTYQRGLQTFVWKAEDANDDKLQYDVFYRRHGTTTWKPLKRQLWDALLTWDTTSVPDGTYTIKVVATDAPGNPPGAALSGEFESPSFTIDNSAPRIEVKSATGMGASTQLVFEVSDTQSPVQRVEYSVDALRWRTLFPVDGIADARLERYEVTLDSGVAPADVTIRAFDALQNVATASGAPPAPPARR